MYTGDVSCGSRPRVLLVEDDRALGAQVEAGLDALGLAVRWVRDGAGALAALDDDLVLVVLDLGLPDANGWRILERIRSGSDVPVLVLTARDDPASRVRGLELGADDYVTKPFWPDELAARVKARLRRPRLARDSARRHGPIALDPVAHEVRVHGELVELSPSEHRILVALFQRPGAAITRVRLAELVLDPDRESDDRPLDVHVSRLRRKLGAAGVLIETVRGVGYRLREEPA